MIAGLFKSSAVSDLKSPTAWLESALGGGRKTASGSDVNANTALTLPVYLACLRAVSEDVAGLPLHVYREEPNGAKSKATDLALYDILHSAPNPDMTAMGFRETMMQFALSQGTAFAEIERDGADVVALWPIHPSRVRSARDEAGRLSWMVRGTFENGRQEVDVEIPDDDMFVLHGLGGDGIRGYSVLAMAAESIGVGLSQQTYAANLFGGSGTVSAVITMANKPTDEQKENLRKQFVERYSGPNASRNPMIFDAATKFERISVNPDEAQAIEARKFQVEDIARVMRMPLSMIGAGAPSAGEREAISYVVYTLTPWCNRWEQEIRRKLIRPSERGSVYAKHSLQGQLRGDHAARAAFYQTLKGSGIINANEARSWEDMDPYAGGDTYFVPMNQIPVESAKDFANAQIQKQMQSFETTQRNPTGIGGGADNEPRDAAASRLIVQRFVTPLSQKLASKESKAIDHAGRKFAGDGRGFSGWADQFYGELASEAADQFTEPLRAASDLLGRVVSMRWAEWYDSEKRLTVEAFTSGTLAERVRLVATTSGPNLSLTIVGDQT